MRDLAAIERLDELRQAGVVGLKIEGRLKNAAWVRRSVELYRQALNSQPTSLSDVAGLGAYTGRKLTCGYLDAQRDELTGSSGRERLPHQISDETIDINETKASNDADEINDVEETEGNRYDLDIMITERAIEYRCECGSRTFDWSMPKTVIRRQHKAVSVADVFHWLGESPIQKYRLGRANTNDPDFLLVRRAASALRDRISVSIRQASKMIDDPVRIDLPLPVRQILEKDKPASANVRTLGETPDRVRLEAAAVGIFLRNVRLGGLIVEGLTAQKVTKMQAICGDTPFVAALPPVFFEDDIPALRELLAECARLKVVVEVNSWGGWHLARQARTRIESGPGLPVLNSLAARQLAGHGIQCVTLSPEADRKQLEELTARCSVSCSLAVFGRPALFTTRVNLPENEFQGKVLADRRGARVMPRREHGLWVLRPVDPFDLRDCRNERICVRHLVVDLVGSDDPVGDWFNLPKRGSFRFNYDRTLA